MVRNDAFVDDFALRVEHTDGVLFIAEIKTDGDNRNGIFHGSEIVAGASSAASHCLLI